MSLNVFRIWKLGECEEHEVVIILSERWHGIIPLRALCPLFCAVVSCVGIGQPTNDCRLKIAVFWVVAPCSLVRAP
jgi:hypothetical protein